MFWTIDDLVVAKHYQYDYYLIAQPCGNGYDDVNRSNLANLLHMSYDKCEKLFINAGGFYKDSRIMFNTYKEAEALLVMIRLLS